MSKKSPWCIGFQWINLTISMSLPPSPHLLPSLPPFPPPLPPFPPRLTPFPPPSSFSPSLLPSSSALSYSSNSILPIWRFFYTFWHFWQFWHFSDWLTLSYQPFDNFFKTFLYIFWHFWQLFDIFWHFFDRPTDQHTEPRCRSSGPELKDSL